MLIPQTDSYTHTYTYICCYVYKSEHKISLARHMSTTATAQTHAIVIVYCFYPSYILTLKHSRATSQLLTHASGTLTILYL